MIKQAFLLLFAGLLAMNVNGTAIKKLKPRPIIVSPRDLIDEATDQLNDLRDVAEGAIEEGVNSIEDLDASSANDRHIILQNSQLAIEEAYQQINGALMVLKNLAFNAGLDITPCLNYREELLNQMPGYFIDQLTTQCLADSNAELTDIIADSRYFIGILINKVDDLEFQLGRCAVEDVFCISPIVTQMESAMVDLPQRVQTEVDRATVLFGGLTVTIQDCTDDKVSAATADGNTILGEISVCVSEAFL